MVNFTSASTHALHAPSLPSPLANPPARLSEPSGFQLKLVVSGVHSGEVTALSFSPALKAVLVTDKKGGLSALDMAVPAVLWYLDLGSDPGAAVQLGVATVPTKK